MIKDFFGGLFAILSYMEYTSNSQDYLHKSALGYMVNTSLSSQAQEEVRRIQDALKSEFGDAIWPAPLESLHITLMDWLAPLVDYLDDKDILFESIFSRYDQKLSRILTEVPPLNLTFDQMVVGSAAIAIVASGDDARYFNKIRQEFLSEINLLPNTKQPPTIVHSTIIRFVGEIPKSDVEEFIKSYAFSFNETIDSFQLVRETTVPMQEFTQVKKYPLFVA